MKRLTQYFLLFFLTRVGIATVVLSGLLAVFDMLARSEDIVAAHQEALDPLFSYVLLRFPEILVLVLPLATLFAGVVSIVQLILRQELVILFDTGKSLYFFARVLLLGGLAIAILYIVITSYILPDTSYRLRVWEENNYTTVPDTEPRPLSLWFEDDKAFIYAENASPDGTVLLNSTLLLRDSIRHIYNYYHTPRMEYIGGQEWELEKVHSQDLEKNQKQFLPSVRLHLGISPDDFTTAKKGVNELTPSAIRALRDELKQEGKSSRLYDLWLQKKYATPLSIFVMILLVLPLGMQNARRSHVVRWGIGSIGIGFFYFFFERFLFSLAETGALPIFLAVWTPALLFSFLSLTVLLHFQK